MFGKIFKKYKNNPLKQKDDQFLEKLVEKGNSHLDQLREIDREILSLQKSTKTTFSFFSPVHNYCRTKYTWYYNWHIKPYATKIHTGVLTLALLTSLGVASTSLFSLPQLAKAVTTDCTWTNGGGNNIWNNSANWSCGNVPNNTNNVIFNGATSTANITIDVAATAASFTVYGTDLPTPGNTAYAGIITANFGLTVDTAGTGTGDFYLGGGTYTANATTITVAGNYARAGGTFTAGTSTINMTATTTGKTFTAGGQTYNNITFNGAGGNWSLVDALNTNSTAIVTQTAGTLHVDGALDNSGLSHSWGNFSSATGTRVLTLGNSTITLTAGVNCWYYHSTGGTLNENTSTIVMSGANSNFGGVSETYYNVRFTGSGTSKIASSMVFNNLTRTGTAVQTDAFQLPGNQTVNGVLTLTGNSAVNRVLVKSSSLGTVRPITLGASATMASVAGTNYVDFQDITMSGGAANERDFQTNGKSAGDYGGNTGIIFTTAEPQTFTNAAGGGWSTVGNWTSRIPLPQDNVSLNLGSAYNSGVTITANMPRLGKNIDCTSMTWSGTATTLAATQSVALTGSLTLTSTMKYTQSSGLSFYGRTDSSFYSAGISVSTISVYMPGARLTLQDAFSSVGYISLASGRLTALSSVLADSMDVSSGTILDMGPSTWTLTDIGCWYNNGTGVVNAETSTIALTYAGATATNFVGGTATYNNIIITPGASLLTFSGAFTFANMTMASVGTKTIKFTKNTTYTMVGTSFFSGTASNLITISSNTSDTPFTLTKASGNVSTDYISLRDSTATGGAVWFAGGHSTNVSGVTGWLFNRAPNSVSALSQNKTDDSVITTGSWTGETSVKFSAIASDPDTTDTLYLCVENDQVGTAFSGTEDLCGAGVAYSGTPVTVTVTIPGITPAQTYHWQARAKDSASAYSSFTVFGDNAESATDFGVDTTSPLNFTPVADPAVWTNANISLTFSTTDASSGLASYQVKIDSGAYSTQTSPYTIDISSIADGAHTATVKAIDTVGNYREASATAFQVDKTAPLDFTPATNPSTWTASNISLTFSTTDASSNINHYEVKIDSGAYSTQTSPYTIDISTIVDGLHTATVKAVDNAGNAKESSLSTFQIDQNASIVTNSTPQVTTPTNQLTVPFAWTVANDGEGSGIDHYLVYIGTTSGGTNIENGTTTTFNSFTKTLATTGAYYIRIKAVDRMGYVSGFSMESSVLIDQTSPIITITNLTDNMYVTAKTFTIEGTASDTTPGISKIMLQIDNNPTLVEATLSPKSQDQSPTQWSYDWNNYTEGNHTIKAKALDKAGNETYTSIFAIIVDTLAPTVPSDFRGFNVSNVPASVFATYIDFAGSTDATLGVKNYEIWKGSTKLSDVATTKETSNPNYTGNTKQSYYLIDSGLSSAKYIYKIKAIDLAGNTSETSELTVDTAGKVIETDNISEAKGNPSSVMTRTKTSSIITWKTVYPASSYVEYGEGTNYGQKTELDNNMNQGHSVLIPDLKPATTYHAKVKSKDIYGKDLESPDFTFTTKPAPDETDPIRVIIKAMQTIFKAIHIGADLPASLREVGLATKQSILKIATLPVYPELVEWAHNDIRARAVDLQTTNYQLPTNLESLQGFSNNLLLTDISFKEKGYYGNILAFEKGKKIEKSTDDKSYSALSSANSYYLDKEIKEGTSYYYRLDGGNPIARKPVLGDDSALTIKNSEVIKESVQSSKDAAQVTVSWTTNRGSSSQVEFGPSTSYGQKTKEDTSLNMGHNIVIEGLTPDTTYHFKTTSKDSSGKIAVSEDFTFQTPTAQKDKTAIDIIFESFRKVWDSVAGIF